MFLAGNAAVLLVLQGQEGSLSFNGAIRTLIQMEWGAIIVLVMSVIIAAIAIQAFEFEGLRFWEGYLRSRVLNGWARIRIASFSKKRTRLEAKCDELATAAFDDARRRALDSSGISPAQVATFNALEKTFHGRPLDDSDRVALGGAADLRWPRFASPSLMHDWDVAKLKLAEFPEHHRVLPTRLGNVMRASEDQVKLAPGEDLEGFMIRHVDELPPAMVAEHGAYRRRLEMYCGLIFVLAALAALSVACLWGKTAEPGWRAAVPLAYVAAMWVAYKAAIASAIGFGQAVKEASLWLQKHTIPLP
ncbi:hypothetical protein GCM10009868_02580 [Terrabacter aerolatus]|uniref:Uncharacterized protein n=1 Tax=Terrabacter aerolatus TaxID=422442 RepID=A0A512D2C7_9MICO|nr:hypothetical protein TAE01_24350 [Terrabacter aerolatus]